MKVSVKSIIFVIVCILCFASFGYQREVWSAPKGKLVVALGGSLLTMDPHLVEQIYGDIVITNVFDFLVKRLYKDGRIQYFPMLATSWEAINETTWVFNLRKGVKFHNGEDFNAEAVKYTIDRILDPATKATKRHHLTIIDRVDILDPYTVKIITKAPSPLIITNFAAILPIVAPKYYKEKGAAYVATHSMGTGPFKFVRWVEDEELVLEANENYWDGPPNIRTLSFKSIPEDSTRAAALIGGDIDIAKDIPAHLIPMVNKSKKAKVISCPSAVCINIYLDTLTKGPLQDKRVRQALNYGVDKEAIIKHILEGHGTPLGNPNITPFHFGYNPSLKPYPYNPEKSKALLKEAGYGDGLTLVLNTPSGRYVKDKEIAEAIAGQLSKVGVKVEVRVHEWGNYTKLLYSTEGGGPMFMMGWAGTYDADGSLSKPLHCGKTLSLWCNQEFDSYLDKARVTMDPKEREKIYHNALRLAHEEAPLIPLYYGVDTYGMSNRVQNWEPTPDVHKTLYMHKTLVKD